MLGDLFKKVRRSEPTQVLILRRFFIIISLFLLAVVFAVSCIGISDELPSIKTTFSLANDAPAPDLAFFFGSNFTINCRFYDSFGNIIQNETECTTRNVGNLANNSFDNAYVGKFLPQDDVVFTSVDGKSTRTLEISISPLVPNPTSNSTILMQAYDRGYSGFRTYIDNLAPYDPFIQEIWHKNDHILSQINSSSSYMWRFTRHKRKIIHRDVFSYIGFSPNYEERSYVESNIEFIPRADTTISGNNRIVTVVIVPQTFTITEETEQRSKTIASALGNVGGFWGIIMSFYIFLFGDGLISPWGFVQKSLKFKPILEDSEPREDEKDDLEKRTRHLEERKKFYEEYIISIPSDERKGEIKP